MLNADDARVAAMAGTAAERGLSVRWFGDGDTADVRAEDIRVTASGTETRLYVDGERYELRLRVLGAHHVKNAQAALTAAVALGIDPAVATERLERVELAERWRMQVMGNDRSAHQPTTPTTPAPRPCRPHCARSLRSRARTSGWWPCSAR